MLTQTYMKKFDIVITAAGKINLPVSRLVTFHLCVLIAYGHFVKRRTSFLP